MSKKYNFVTEFVTNFVLKMSDSGSSFSYLYETSIKISYCIEA